MSKLAFQIGGKVVCNVSVENQGLTLNAYRLDNNDLIGHVFAVVGSNNRPTGSWGYALNDAKDDKHVGSQNWHAGNNRVDAMVKMLKRAKLTEGAK